jgi:hypothetical protein
MQQTPLLLTCAPGIAPIASNIGPNMIRSTVDRALKKLGKVSAADSRIAAPMTLTAFRVEGHQFSIRPAPLEREWMDNSAHRYAYRCLPLNIANAHGWEILCDNGVTAIWNGKHGLDDLFVQPDRGEAVAVSHFGHGILTFHVNSLFVTDPGVDLMVQGPVNRPKDAIAPLTGIVETDWSPYSFTMNWMFTRPGISVRFEKGEPFCHIFPIRRGELEKVNPEMRPLANDADLERHYGVWSVSRERFNADLKQPGSRAQQEKWQKWYYRGEDSDGHVRAKDHRTRIRLKPFKTDRTGRT